MIRTASAIWQGGLKQGQGTLSTQSGALKTVPYSFTARFAGGIGTNPEELIAAALAGCFTMALAAALEREGITPVLLSTTAAANLEQVQGEWTITGIQLALHAKVPGIELPRFEEVATKVKKTCPISRALNAPISLAVQLDVSG